MSTDERDDDPEILESFWVSGIFSNAALFGASLGLMLWYFREQALLGGSLVVVDLLAGARTYMGVPPGQNGPGIDRGYGHGHRQRR